MALYLTARAEPAAEICHGRRPMASIDQFNEHCWKDVVPESDMKLYAGWRAKRSSGRDRPCWRSISTTSSIAAARSRRRDRRRNIRQLRNLRASCRRADQAAVRGGAPRRHCRSSSAPRKCAPNTRPAGAVSTAARPRDDADNYAIYREFRSQTRRSCHHQAARQRLSGHAALSRT